MEQKLHRCGVGVYPNYEDPADLGLAREYIRKAARLGFDEVFSSMHLPELSYTDSMDQVRDLGNLVRELGLAFQLDISGGMLRRILGDNNLSAQMREIPLDWLRLDYGVSLEETCRLAATLGIPGLMVNASVLTGEELAILIPSLRREAPGVHIRAHHNYYPRPETGLSMAFMTARSAQYLPWRIPVTGCVASLQNPRLPMKAGLPTVEAHRGVSCQRAARELLATGVVDDLLVGDPYAADEELAEVVAACRRMPLPVRLAAAPGLTPQEREIVFGGVHRARPDAAAWSIRSLTSRQMATPGALVPARAALPRKAGTVAIDNEHYRRYSGELQIITADLPADERVNVAGEIHPEDLWKMEAITPGTEFTFIE